VVWPKIGCVGPTCPADWLSNLSGRPSFLLVPPLGIGYLEHHLSWHVDKMVFGNAPTHAGQGDVADWPHLGSVEPMLCATSFPHVILSVTMPYFGHNEDMHGFWSIECFSIIRCS
jgi:hypothetical protein